MKEAIEIDGASFDSLEGFFAEVDRKLIPGPAWGHNLDAFNDILRGGFGTPDDGFVLVWKYSEWPSIIVVLQRQITDAACSILSVFT